MKIQQGKSRKKGLAIAALLSSATIADAATQVGVSERTLVKWLSEEEFVTAYRQAQGRLLEQSINSLRQAALVFTTTLRDVAADTDAPPGSRAQAARSGLEVLLRAVTLEDLERRLSELERSASTIERRH